jgi:hypothetical protein
MSVANDGPGVLEHLDRDFDSHSHMGVSPCDGPIPHPKNLTEYPIYSRHGLLGCDGVQTQRTIWMFTAVKTSNFVTNRCTV